MNYKDTLELKKLEGAMINLVLHPHFGETNSNGEYTGRCRDILKKLKTLLDKAKELKERK